MTECIDEHYATKGIPYNITKVTCEYDKGHNGEQYLWFYVTPPKYIRLGKYDRGSQCLGQHFAPQTRSQIDIEYAETGVS